MANEGDTSSSFILAQPVYHNFIQPTYQEQIQQSKSNTPTSTNKLPTHRKKKGFPRTAHMAIQKYICLRGSVIISQYVVSRVYEMHYILSLICSGTSAISTKFHQALKLQIGL